MAFIQKPNTGALFKNDSDNALAPAYRGNCNVNGRDMQISAWLNTKKDGEKYMALKFQEPFDQTPRPEAKVAPVVNVPVQGDDIPF
jgi:uncharacterized protein (DUF736 family)